MKGADLPGKRFARLYRDKDPDRVFVSSFRGSHVPSLRLGRL